MATSTLTTQQLVDYARTVLPDQPMLGVAGYPRTFALTIANTVMRKILAENNPWKWNKVLVPVFYSQPYQQDYPTSISMNTLGWLQSGTFTDINNTTTPKPQPPIEVVQDLLPTFILGIPSKVCWVPNSTAITGTWPGANTLYQNPLNSAGGGPGNNPLTAITDLNGNIQVVTTYGTTGASQPSWPAASSAAGVTTTDGSVVWTVQDPNGIAFRIDKLATNGSNVWQFNLSYQAKPPAITTLTQTFAPIPDDLDYLIQQGFLIYCYRSADTAEIRNKFSGEYAQWLEDVKIAMGSSDREKQEFGFYPDRPIQGGYGSGTGGYTYVGWPGWTSSG